MQVRSLGLQTDLALLRLEGSIIEDRGDHLVIRTPHNPGYWSGNSMLLSARSASLGADDWVERFSREFPEARHRTFAVDAVDGTTDDLGSFVSLGFSVGALAVMTAERVRPPRHSNACAEYRELLASDDWSQSAALRLSTMDRDIERFYREDFVRENVATSRRLVESGHGSWFGAFVDGQLVSQLGLLRAREGLARFQSVETHPDHRRQGLAGGLVHHASRFGFDRLDAKTLVMCADPDYFAIDLYRSVGFEVIQRHLQAKLIPKP